MLSNEVRQSFLDFFKGKAHTIVPSAPVIPAKDPTLLFTNAGMNQFKDVFLAEGTREYKRAVDSQKCIRVSGKHNDLEEVGVDTYHHTFFEMLGNWSFGDYYKKEAITWAWELMTEVWKLDKNRLYATVYLEDDEAEELWFSETDIDKSHVSRLGKEENFWEMGDTGPCGPCSEIHYDLGEEFSCGPKCKMGCECGRYIELWNLVFIQFDRQPNGELKDLPAKHVDTGMGFERMTAVLQGKTSNYDTDIFMPIIDFIGKVTGHAYERENHKGVAFRVIADHIRALTFAIGDGALPSNEGRGYVLRRILRRAARFGRNLEMQEPFIYKLVAPLADKLGDVYPEIREKADYIAKVLKSEEESFGNTLDRGLDIFNRVAGEVEKTGTKTISGQDAFQLYDTYGFPLDLTELMARERNLSVDVAGFNSEMAEQKKRSFSKKALIASGDAGSGVDTIFDYHQEEISTKIGSILDDNNAQIDKADSGMEVTIQLRGSTPFYAESGGQIGDTGVLIAEDNSFEAEVLDTQKTSDTKIFHRVKVISGVIRTDAEVTAKVDGKRRLDIKRNHTATHLLHKALRDTLGTHVHQAGSLVAPDHLRFDFNHYQKMTDEEVRRVESIVNETIRKNIPVEPMPDVDFSEAKKLGAMALFGEKYGDRVRVVKIGDYSLELCGGTHMDAVGDIGEFRIVHEQAVATGVRRIVAETGDFAVKRTLAERDNLEELKHLLNVDGHEIVTKVEHLLEEKKHLERAIKEIRQKSASSQLDEIISDAKKSSDTPLLAYEFPVASVDELKDLGDRIRGKMSEGAALLGATIEEKTMLVCVVGDMLIKEKSWKAGDIVKELAKEVGGGGGGKPHMATAGIKDKGKLQDALEIFPRIVNSIYNGN